MIDQEISALVESLNKVPGFRTTCSCFGHGKDPVKIWLFVNSISDLNRFMWAGCHRYFDLCTHGDWVIEIDNGDTDRESKVLSLLLRSKEEQVPQEKIDAFSNGVEEWLKSIPQ